MVPQLPNPVRFLWCYWTEHFCHGICQLLLTAPCQHMLAASCVPWLWGWWGRQEARCKQGSKVEPSWQVRGGSGPSAGFSTAGHHLHGLWGRVAAVTFCSHRNELPRLATGSQIHNQMNQVSEWWVCKSCLGYTLCWACCGRNGGDRACLGWAKG